MSPLVPVVVALILTFAIPAIATGEGKPAIGHGKRLGLSVVGAMPGALVLQVAPDYDPVAIIGTTVAICLLCVFPLVLASMLAPSSRPVAAPVDANPVPQDSRKVLLSFEDLERLRKGGSVNGVSLAP